MCTDPLSLRVLTFNSVPPQGITRQVIKVAIYHMYVHVLGNLRYTWFSVTTRCKDSTVV